MTFVRYIIFTIPILFILAGTLLAQGMSDVIYGFHHTFSFSNTYHLLGIVGIGVWGNQARKSRVGNLSILFLLSLGVSCFLGMSVDVQFDMRPIVAGEIIFLGILISRSIGLNAIWDVGAVMLFGLLHGVMLGVVAKGKAPMFFPLGVILSGIVLLLIGALITWLFGIRDTKGSSSRNNNAPFAGGILVGAGITIMIWVLA